MQTISKQQVIRLLERENVWWSHSHSVPDVYRKLTPRAYFKLFYPLVQASSVRRAVVLMGPRRVGKTVMIHHAIQELLNSGVNPEAVCYFSVDHPIYNGLSLENLLEIYQEATGIQYSDEQCYIFFDEIQYLRNWEIHLKIMVDVFPNLKCIVSGSAAAALRLKSIESGAGRFTDFLLPPLTFYEYLELSEQDYYVKYLIEPENPEEFYIAKDINKLNEKFIHYLNFGGYPEVIFSQEIQSNPERFIKSDIIDKVLLRDLPSLYGIEDIQELNYLFTTLVYNTANEVSLEELSKGSGVAKNTIKKYIEYLEAAFLLKTIHRIDKNAKRFQRANFFKVYMTNPSIRCALFSPITSDDSAIGALVETAIFAQWFHSDKTHLYYARWKNGEVDIVNLDKQQNVDWAVEVKWSDRIITHISEMKNMIQFCHVNNLNKILVTTKTQYASKLTDNVRIKFVPASIYCYTLGYNLLKGKITR